MASDTPCCPTLHALAEASVFPIEGQPDKAFSESHILLRHACKRAVLSAVALQVGAGNHMLSIIHHNSHYCPHRDVLTAVWRQDLCYHPLILCLPVHGGLHENVSMAAHPVTVCRMVGRAIKLMVLVIRGSRLVA